MRAILLKAVRLEAYTFVDMATGENTHLNSGALREWCAGNRATLEVFPTPVDPAIAKSFIEVDRSVSAEHLVKVAGMPFLDPIIYCKSGTFSKEGAPDVMLADGHHRYVIAAAKGVLVVPAYILEPAQWKPFTLALPDMSAEELRAVNPKEVRT